MNVVDVLPRDAIQSVDDPDFGPSHFGRDDDEVVVVDGTPPRAYPVRVLVQHEIVNDTVDGRPVAVTWCPICRSGAVYDRRVDEETLTFGVSGKLADDALVMYDRETDSEWVQPSGEAIAGPHEGTRLERLAGPVVTYGEFRASHPEGLVLQPPRGTGERALQEYDAGAYDRYDASEAFGLYGMRGEGQPREWDHEDLDPKALLVGVEFDGDAMGYPAERVRAVGGIVRDTVGGVALVVVATASGLHAFEAPGHDLTVEGDRLSGGGTTWDPVSGESADGRHLRRVPAVRLYAFAWLDAHGPDAVWSG
jgi:hypothetical protein